ncbi:MAG: hypothetical protein KDH99_08520 [Alcanivoracaceae bacterium]|nr:hypothetical protein [Alcanivoracaceae bacterium]
MNRRYLTALLVPLLLVSSPGMAALARLDLDALALDIWRVRAAFHAHTAMQGDPRYLEELDELVAEADDLMATLEDSVESDDEQVFVDSARDAWETFRELAGQNTYAELGYTDHYTIVDMETAALSLSELIDTQRTDTAGKGEDLADLAVRLQRIASEYMFTAALPDAGGAIGTGAEEGRLEFVEAVPDFDARLQAAEKAWAGNPDVSRELSSVVSKWAFIRQSLVKFYENSVPFVVHRYAGQMVESLNQAAELARK